MGTAITGHTTSRGGAYAPPSRLFRLANPGLANLLVTGGDAEERARVAREFHVAGRLRRGPFVAASPRSADWVQLFFQALSDPSSLEFESPLRRAEGGTLFLDEVDGLGGHAQRLLLEFLQHGRSRGARDSGWAGLIAVGAHDDLRSTVARGRFLAPLHDALDKICIDLSLVC